MGCVQSSAAARRGGDGAAKKRPPLSQQQLSGPPHGNSLLRERAIAARATGRSTGDYRQHHQIQQDDAAASPEADLPINWNLRFKDLVILEHIANG